MKPVIGFTLSLSWVMIGSGVDPAQGFADVQALAMGLMAFLAAALVPSFMFKFIPQVLGLSYEEAAETCGCPIGTIRSRVARAREDLAAALDHRPASSG